MAAKNPFNDDLYGHHPLRDRYQERSEASDTLVGKMLHRQRVSRPGWEQITGKCESPIEELMCALLCDALLAVPHAGEFDLREAAEMADKAPNGSVIIAYAQQRIGRYRADFLLACFDKKYGSVRRIVVECDGKEFHQDKYADAERDQCFQREGYWVLRFTGAEIYDGAPDLGARVSAIMYLADS